SLPSSLLHLPLFFSPRSIPLALCTFVLLEFFLFSIFFFHDPATTEIYTLSLHDALPIARGSALRGGHRRRLAAGRAHRGAVGAAADGRGDRGERGAGAQARAGRGLGAHGVVGGRGRPDVDVRALAGGGRVRRPAGPGAALLRSRGAG